MKITVVLDNIRSALNVGAILRTCNGAGVEQVFLAGITPPAMHPKVAKTALGAEAMVTTRRIPKTEDVVRNTNAITIAVEQHPEAMPFNELPIDVLHAEAEVMLIMGHEITGVSPAVLEVCDIITELPMLGEKKSLNVATTTGIMLYTLAFFYGKKN